MMDGGGGAQRCWQRICDDDGQNVRNMTRESIQRRHTAQMDGTRAISNKIHARGSVSVMAVAAVMFDSASAGGCVARLLSQWSSTIYGWVLITDSELELKGKKLKGG